MKIVLTGASGYLGHLLTGHFTSGGHEVAVISRHKPQLPPGARFVAWDGRHQGPWSSALDGADAVINLAGRTVNCRYNEENRRQILESRLHATRAVGQAVAAASRPPAIWLNSSSATVYRDARDRPMDEAGGDIGSGFSVDVCLQWESALMELPLPGVRRIAMRLSMVFGRDAEVFKVMSRLVKLGLGGTQGDGVQYVSWLHDADFVRAVDWMLAHPELGGPVNVCAPAPLPNHEFMGILRRALKRPLGLPAPRPALEIGAFLMGTETELILKSRRVVPGKLLDSGFTFQFDSWRAAVDDVARVETATG